MDLFLIKAEKGYFRFVESGYELVNMQKASVYPKNQLEGLRLKAKQVQEDHPGAAIYKLKITEELYE